MMHKISKALLTITGSTLLATTLTWSLPAAATEPFLGQIDYFGFNFAPRGWSLCDGQVLSINSNQSLFSLLGTIYGGDGRTSFALPDMRGRMPLHFGTGAGLSTRNIGQRSGAETETLAAAGLPAHTHSLRGSTNPGDQVLPGGNVLADDAPDETYRDEAPNADMKAGSVGATALQSHDNMPPYLVINCGIATQGLFPSRN